MVNTPSQTMPSHQNSQEKASSALPDTCLPQANLLLVLQRAQRGHGAEVPMEGCKAHASHLGQSRYAQDRGIVAADLFCYAE
jgi:hypothetical protein